MEGLILEAKKIQEKEKLKNKLIDLRTKVLSNYKDPQLMFSAFKTESDTIKGYNGRQVLELFQNCDDENSPEVLIKIDKERNVFSISNIGTPFSEKGYDSLFYASLSSKISGKFIGNKGLGFRSIINWANEINIYSNGICLKYAPKFIEKAFTELYPSHKERLELLEERGLVENVIPLPLLSYPDISEKTLDNGYTTTIEIFYKEGFYQNIVEQVKSITEETLLFLNTIKHVKFEGFDNQKNIEVTQKNKLEIVTNKTTPTSIITINNKSWNIIEETNQLDEKYQNKESTKKDFYQLKIAFQNDFSDTVYKLYSYFLTEEELYFPFLVHGTFELNQNRKRISNDINEEGISKNGFILNRLALLIINTAKSFSNSEKSNWKPLLFLKHNKTNASLNVFFETLENKILSEKLFPCVDNSYKKRDDVLYISDSFSKMIQNLSLESFFPNHIIPIDKKNINLSIYQIKNTITNITELVNRISKIKLSIENRALFIYEIVKAFPAKQFDFLIDENEIPIKANEYIFTPRTGKKDLIKPEKTTINFLNKDLYVKLSNLFGFDSAKSVGRSRFVMQKLNNNCNIHEYEPNRLALKIISETNDKLKLAEIDSVSLIQEMNKCLYHNFKQTDDIYNFNKETSVPTINKNGEIAICKNLYLSADYPKGKLTEQIFENIYDQSEYIASPSKLGLDVNDEDFDINKVEDFLIWILTNTYAKYVSYDLVSSGLNSYVQYVQNYNSSIVDYRGYTISYKEIVGFENILNKISIEKLLLWINVDNELEQQLIDDQNNIIYKARIVNHRHYTTINNKPSYIKYQILSNSKFQFHNHLIDDKTEWLNDIKINYDSPLFINHQIIKLKINNSLLLLNAKEDFNHLSISYVTSLFEKLNNYTIKKEGKGSQAFYKKVYNHFKQNGKELTKKVNLFAKSNGTIHLFKQEEIYFSDNIKLPENLTDKYPIFNYPSRAGGSEAINIFKINDIKNLNTRLNHYVKNETLSDAFNKIFIDLKPFILSFRLENLKTEKSKENDVSKLKNIEIELSDKIECAIETSTFIIDDYEYYYKGNNRYLITVKNKNIKDILLEPKFADSFAEILASTFDTNNEKDDFRYLIRNSEAYSIHLIEQKFGLSIIDEAKVLLGQANEKISFWKNIYDIKKWSTQNLENNDYSKILEVLDNKSLPNIGYSNINNTQNYKIIQSLFNKLNIDIITFNTNAIDKIDLYDLNYKKIEQALEKKSSLIKASLWKSLENSSINEQSKYLRLIGKYKNKDKFTSEKANQLKFQFDFNLDEIVKDYIEEKYPNLELVEILNLDKKRVLNLKYFNSEEISLIETNLKLMSLIFFESAIESIKVELKEKSWTKSSEENEILESNSLEENNQPIILNSDALESRQVLVSKNKGGRGVYMPSFDHDKKKKKKGNIAEKVVLDYFMNNDYKDIDPVAIFDPFFHYDIQYTNENGDVKYVEVKSFDSGSFHLSKSEYDFGLRKKENYEIWLVKDNNIIIPIYDFFSNPKYKTTINEYIIHLEIANN
ncbi:sacsin N-terminal ATP-binding-like domain-containing protein [Tenacibaculum finnmarkense]|uniref:sacsin N-terminal ATP-binding-like domain-containing protein n=1 Tax=Tenacibaculum finnmarkense TaxID=2781243 RepID=UPI003BB62B26